MTDEFVAFDELKQRVLQALGSAPLPDGLPQVCLLRDLFGKVRITTSEKHADTDAARSALAELAALLEGPLGVRGHPASELVLPVSDELLASLGSSRRTFFRGIDWAERLVVGTGWGTVTAARQPDSPRRFTLYSVKGGVGRSTTAAVLTRYLAAQGERVLTVDLDLESPGLSSALLEPKRRPKFGVTDWFVEDLVEQGDAAISDMFGAPSWAHEVDGDARVVAAHGADPGEYLHKLGRAYMNRFEDPWTQRLARMLTALEAKSEISPTVVLLESRSGLHDIAAAAVTDLDAEVLLFMTDTESNWTDYDMLFQHWNRMEIATELRERMFTVSALTPERTASEYLSGLRENAWGLFQESIYDPVKVESEHGDGFAFDLDDQTAPHSPLVIYWARGLAVGASLRNLDGDQVELAYGEFLERFTALMGARPRG